MLMPRWMTLLCRWLLPCTAGEGDHPPSLEILDPLDPLDRLDRLTTPVEKTAARDDSPEVGATARRWTGSLGPAVRRTRPLAPAEPEPFLYIVCGQGTRYSSLNGKVITAKGVKGIKAIKDLKAAEDDRLPATGQGRRSGCNGIGSNACAVAPPPPEEGVSRQAGSGRIARLAS